MTSPRKSLTIAGALALALALPFLVAQVGPSGGLPSKPRFNSVGLGMAAPAGSGDIAAKRTADGAMTWTIDNDANDATNQSRLSVNSGDASAQFLVGGSGRTTPILANGSTTTGAQAVLRSFGSYPLEIGTANTLAMSIDASQVVDFVNTPTIAGSPISAPLVAVKTADEAVTSSVVLQNDDALTLTFPNGPASTFYAVTFFVNWNQNGSTTNGIRMNMTAGGGAVTRGERCDTTTNTSATAVAPVAQTANNDLVHTAGAGGTAMQIAICQCTVEADAAGSTITLQWAQAASVATSTRVSLGSSVVAHRLN